MELAEEMDDFEGRDYDEGYGDAEAEGLHQPPYKLGFGC